MKTNIILNGDCIQHMKEMPKNSVDAIITDPPYGLEFMGKEWDKFGVSEARAKRLKGIDNKGSGDKFSDEPNICEGGNSRIKGLSPSFKEKPAMQIFIEIWAKEGLRILKPGAFMLVFGGTRTYHRLVCGIEDAGFEIRDTIMWLYGSGFPKSMNISKAIDKMHSKKRKGIKRTDGMATRPRVLEFADRPIKTEYEDGLPITDEAKEWEGWGTALKPACEPIVVARKPLSEKSTTLNILKWGVGGLNIDSCRIKTDEIRKPMTIPDFRDVGKKVKEEIGIDKLNFGQIENAKRIEYNPNQQGRFPANIILECTCDKVIKGKQKAIKQGGIRKSKDEIYKLGFKKEEGYIANAPDDYGDSGNIHTDPNCPCYVLDIQSGKSLSKGGQSFSKTSNIYGKYANDRTIEGCGFGDSGGASRFFYCAKASKGERNLGCDELEPKQQDVGRKEGNPGGDNPRNRGVKKRTNFHPTVKPIQLMEYLIKLVTKQKAIVLDPFLGSGTTAIACLRTNREWIGIEKESEYIQIANARIKPFLEQKQLENA